MKDFKSYQKSQSYHQPKKSAHAQNQGAPLEGEAAELAKKALSAFNGKSENAVLLEILRQAEAGKRNGTLTNEQIDEFYRQFSPMLSEVQRQKFQTVIQRLKKI